MILEKEIIKMAQEFANQNKEEILSAKIINPDAEVSFFSVFDKNNDESIIHSPLIKDFINKIYDFCFLNKEEYIKTDFLNHLPEYNKKTLAEIEAIGFFNKDVFFKETIFPIFMFIWAVVKGDTFRSREILTIRKSNFEKIIPTTVCPVCNKKLMFDYDSKNRQITLSQLQDYQPCKG